VSGISMSHTPSPPNMLHHNLLLYTLSLHVHCVIRLKFGCCAGAGSRHADEVRRPAPNPSPG